MIATSFICYILNRKITVFFFNQKQAKDFPISLPGKLTSGLKPNRKIPSGKENNSLSCKAHIQPQDHGENSYVAFNFAEHNGLAAGI